MPLVCPWQQGTADRDVTTRLKFSQPERIRLGHANIQNTTIYARLTTATLDSTARKVFASHRVV
jgi:hypothetical protein